MSYLGAPKCMNVDGEHKVIAYMAKHGKPHQVICARCGADEGMCYDHYYFTAADGKRYSLCNAGVRGEDGKEPAPDVIWHFEAYRLNKELFR
jgi:hypothetical protein